MKAFSIKGKWEVQKNNISTTGELFFDPEKGAELILDQYQSEGFSFEKVDFIHGTSYEGKLITLYDCTGYDTDNGYSFICEYVFVGCCFIQPPTFTVVSASFSYLTSWVGKSGIKTEFENDNKKIVITSELPEEIEIGNYKDCRYKITFSREPLNKDFFVSEQTVSHETLFKIESAGKMGLEKIRKDLIAFSNLINFAKGSPSYVLKLMGESVDHIEKEKYIPIEIYFLQINFENEKKKQYYRWLFNLNKAPSGMCQPFCRLLLNNFSLPVFRI